MSLKLDETYWSGRYRDNDAPWDIGSISTPLQAYFDQLSDKAEHILIPGAGNAYEAEYLVSKGFSNVYVCDLSLEPLNNLKQRCPAFKPEHLLHEDFFDLKDNSFDYIFEQTFFCALDPGLRKKYFEKMYSLLKPGGKLVGVLFNDTLNSDKPPFGGTKKEYLSYIPATFNTKVFDICYNSIKPRAGRELFINLSK